MANVQYVAAAYRNYFQEPGSDLHAWVDLEVGEVHRIMPDASMPGFVVTVFK